MEQGRTVQKRSARFLWALLVVLGAGGAFVLWNEAPSPRRPALPAEPIQPLPPPGTFKGDPKEATEKLLSALNRELGAMDLLKLLEEDVSTQRVRVGEKEILSYQETFRLPLRYSLNQVLGPLHRAARELGAGLSADPAKTLSNNGNVLYSCEFSFSQEWVPVRLHFREVRTPRICLILDDLGYQKGETLELLYSLRVPVTAAFIPGTRYSSELAQVFPSKGIEVMCHMPMEGREAGGVGEDYAFLLKKGMGGREVKSQVQGALESLPHCVGLNNHMGSVATEDPDLVWDVCQVAGAQGLYLIDSKTTKDSVVEFVARKAEVPVGKRDVFLDNVLEEEAIRRQLKDLAQKAARKGLAVGIGHFKTPTLRVLAEEIPSLREQGFRFVYASEIVE